MHTHLQMGAIVTMSQRTMGLSWMVHAVVFCLGYFGQELSHYVTGEQTFQSSYQAQRWVSLVFASVACSFLTRG